MISEILKIIPRLDDAALGKMEKALNGRFAKVAKKFGSGLTNIIKGAGIVGLAVGFIDKLLNPLKETQDAIERMINQGDDIVTNAEQFNTSAGKLFKLQAFARASGLQDDGLNMLLTKYQTAVAEAQADPKKNTAVRAFADDGDIVDSFFEFIQSLKKMDRNQQILVQKEVFGEKQNLKMADFLRNDFEKLNAIMRLQSAESYDAPLQKLGNLNDLNDALRVGRESNDVFTKARNINEGMIRGMNASAKIQLDRENERIKAFKNLKSISDAMEKISGAVEQLVSGLGKSIGFIMPYVEELIKYLKAIAGSRMLRGMSGQGKGE